jgi:hypothetical protein
LKSSLDSTAAPAVRPIAERQRFPAASGSAFEHHLIETRKVSPRSGTAATNKFSWRSVATVAVVVITTLLILKLGIWYFVGLVAVYVGLDVAQRLKTRREGRNSKAIAIVREQPAQTITFNGARWHCGRAARVAHQCGWIAQPMQRGGLWRSTIRFRHARRATSAAELLDALSSANLATRIAIRDAVPPGSQPPRQSFRDTGRGL